MAEFEKAIAFVLPNEGGFVDNPNDSGGATNFGLSLRFLRTLPVESLRKYGVFVTPEDLSVENVKELTLDQARNIYKSEFWDHHLYEKIVDQHVANYVFDMVIHHGEHQAIKILQRALWAVYQHIHVVVDDGILGSKTLDLIDDPACFAMNALIVAMMAERAGFVRLLANERSKDKEFLDGWLNRCYRI
jgi:lysozyme family protein